MTDVTEIRARHMRWSSRCRHCGVPWPCDAARAADEAERLREKVDALTTEYLARRDAWQSRHRNRADDAEAERDRLRAQVDAVRATVGSWPDGDERFGGYAAARGQAKRAVLAALADATKETGGA